ncbi:MAG: hypothetical protein NTZ73_02855 [Candidatus Diapherotrites archaeon]|nr:hypothetical protein [Candidatus Diapherotrites archaeon]
MSKHSLKVGISFGVTSGIITTLGLISGLSAETHSKLIVLGGIMTIAIADSLSDALGVHVSEESEGVHGNKEVWIATAATFFSKLIFTLSFFFIVLFSELSTAVPVSIAWGLIVISIVSFLIARQEKKKPFGVIAEHILIAIAVVVATNYAGGWIAAAFGA